MTISRTLAVCLALSALSAPPAGAAEVDDATRIFETAFAVECDWALGGSSDMRVPEVFPLSYQASWDEPDAPEQEVRLYRFFCSQGAYNTAHVYMLANEGGIGIVQFATPEIDVDYATGADGEPDDARVEAMRVAGFSTRSRLTNSEVDEDAGIISSAAYWRGLGDAADTGEWRLIDGRFVLTRFTVDASYDGEVTPIDVVAEGQVVLTPPAR